MGGVEAVAREMAFSNSGDPRLNVVRDPLGVGMAPAAVGGGRDFCLAVAICR